MKYTATITRLSDGKMVTWADELDDNVWGLEGTQHGIWYMWAEGNYACDCNRDLYFCMAEGESNADYWKRVEARTEEQLDEGRCGVTRYTVPHVDLENGTRIAIDTDPVQAAERAAEAEAQRKADG